MVSVARGSAVAAGVLADLVLGDPPTWAHPVGWFGSAMSAYERVGYGDDRAAGGLHAGLGVALGVAAGRVCGSTGLATAIAVGGKNLSAVANDIATRLEHDDLAGARCLLPSLVGRDPEALDADGVARAVAESVAENTVDAVVAPIWWGVVGGASGVLAHRAVNTMDAMVGHHSARYERYGWASARLDDAAAWLPARLTAVLVAAVRPRRAADVHAAVRGQAPAHPSPNSGVAEAAFAAALGITLGGETRYRDRTEHRPRLGSGPEPTWRDIRRATRLSRDVTLAAAALAVLADTTRRKP